MDEDREVRGQLAVGHRLTAGVCERERERHCKISLHPFTLIKLIIHIKTDIFCIFFIHFTFFIVNVSFLYLCFLTCSTCFYFLIVIFFFSN